MAGPRSWRTAGLAVAALVVLLPLAGCLDYDETLTVAGDGSGTLAIDLKLDLSFIAEIKKIDPQPESEDSGDVKNFVTKDEILKDCEVPGVTVTKCEVEEQGQHKSHVQLVLSFKDLDALRAVRFFSDREIVVEEKGDDVSFAYRYNARSVLNMLGMGLEGEDPDAKAKDQATKDKEDKIRGVLDTARRAAGARFLLKMPGKLLTTNGEKDGDTASRWTVDKKNPKAQAALLKEPLSMELTLSKKDAPFWEKERESAKKRAAAEDAPGKAAPGKDSPGKTPAPRKPPGIGDGD